MAMQFGFVSAILAEQNFKEVIDFASDNGFSCVELMCWPVGKAERRYAGVTHIDVDTLDADEIKSIQDYTRQKQVAISALGYYPNPLDANREKRDIYIHHIRKIIEASAALGINRITTFIGKDPAKTIDENLDRFVEVWSPLIELAEKLKVYVAIENCPMYFTMDQWPGGLNLATTPAIWRRMFAALPSAFIGLNYDPSHLVWQQMDYIKPIYEFKDKIFHVHFKDIKVYRDRLNDVGIMATPLEYMSPKLPGQGDVDWGQYVSALNDIRYCGPACIEVEDKAYESNLDDCKRAVITSRNYLSQFIY